MSDGYVKTEIKDECEKCNSENTETFVKRVYKNVDIEVDSFNTQTVIPLLKYKKKCNNCGYKNIYFL